MNLRSILVKVSATIAVVLAVCMACFVFYTSHILEREIKEGVETTIQQNVALLRWTQLSYLIEIM